MAFILDFSNISESIKAKAIYHITNNDYVVSESSNTVKIADNWKDLAIEEIENAPYPFSQFWLEFSIGIEYLSKSVLVKQEIDIFSKKQGRNLERIHSLTGSIISTDEFEGGTQIAANNNLWLNHILISKDIKYVKQLKTGTLGKIYNTHLIELLNKGVISQSEFDLIKDSLQILSGHKRNNDLHFYFKQNVLMENSDIIDMYVPVINLLLDVFER